MTTNHQSANDQIDARSNRQAFLPRFASWSALVLRRFLTALNAHPAPEAALPRSPAPHSKTQAHGDGEPEQRSVRLLASSPPGFIESTLRSATLLACLLGWLISLSATAASTNIPPGNPSLLQQCLSAGYDVSFSTNGVTGSNIFVTLSAPLIITNNASLDGLIISTGTNSVSVTNFVSIVGSPAFTNVVTSIQTNLVLTTIYTTNEIVTTNGYNPITGLPILVTNDVPTSALVYTNVVTTNINLFASGPRLFVISAGVTSFTLRNLTLSGGLGTNYGGAISNGGTLLVSNCIFVGNTAYGPPGTLGANGASSTYSTGGDGQPGGWGGIARGGAIYNAGTARILASQIVTNWAVAGNGGTGGNGGDGSWTGGTGGNGGNGGAAQGGGIYNGGVLTMQACLLTDDVAQAGDGGTGGINGSGSPNGLVGKGGAGAQAAGGGLYNAGTVFLAACTFAWNGGWAGESQKAGTPDLPSLRNGYAGGDSFGGAIFNAGSNTMVNCTLSYNTARAGKGGDGGDGRADSLAYGNGGNGGNAWGGGLFNGSGVSALTNCTLAGSGAVGGTNGIGTTSPFVGNDGSPGGAYGGNLASGGGTCLMRASILASSSAGATTAGANAYGSVNNLGYNLSSDSTPAFSGLGSVVNTNPQLAPLNTNGGPVPTMALLATTNNPALDKVVPPALPALFDPPTDARGIVRPQGGRGDLGAFELEAVNLSGHITADSQPLANVPITVLTPTGATNIITDATGGYAFTNLPPGTYTLTPSADGYEFTPPVRIINVTLAPTTNADFTATGFFTIYGQITTNGFAGLAGAKVTAGARSDITDGDGYYALTNMAPGSVVVTPQLTNYGFLPASYPVTVVDTDVVGVDFGAALVWTISGTITNEATGKGMSNITVTAISVFSFAGYTETNQVTTTSDASGAYRLPNVFAGTNVTLQLAAVGYVFGITNTFTLTNNTTQNIRVHSAYSISGIVIFGGAGLGGVSVTATATNGAATASALTDANGVYILNLLPTNRYTLQAQLAGYTFNTNSVYVPPNASNINFTAQGALSISGHITRNGQGLSGVSVVVGTSLPVTDTNGFYNASNLPPGNYTVTPYLARQAFAPLNIPVTLTTDNFTGQDFTATPLCNINGRVTLGGVGLSNVNVRAVTTTTNTDHNGYYTLTSVQGGSNVVVTPTLPGYAFAPASSNLSLWANAANINFSAMLLSSISGSVTLGGTGLSNVTVTATATNGTPAGSVQTDSLGAYTLTGLLTNRYNLQAQLAGYNFSATNFSNPVSVPPSATTVNFAAQGALSISGHIRTNGVGLGGVRVVVGSSVTNTDGNGFYMVTNLGPGSFTVTPSLTNYVFGPANILVALSSNLNNQDFTAAPLCNINGRVTSGGVGLSNVTLTAGTTTTTSDTNGYYTLTSVLGGSNVVVIPALTGYTFMPASSNLALWGDAANVNFAALRFFSISGKLLEGSNGVAGLEVSIASVTNLTDANGNYVLDHLTNGAYTVTPQFVGVGFRPLFTNVTLSGGSLSNVNFTANPPHISITLSNGTPKLTVTGLPLRFYEVLANTNSPASTNWQLMVAEYADTNAIFTVLDTNAPALKARFYRPSTP